MDTSFEDLKFDELSDLTMADNHRFVVDFVEDYEQKVVFYVDTMADEGNPVTGDSITVESSPQRPGDSPVPPTAPGQESHQGGQRDDVQETGTACVEAVTDGDREDGRIQPSENPEGTNCKVKGSHTGEEHSKEAIPAVVVVEPVNSVDVATDNTNHDVSATQTESQKQTNEVFSSTIVVTKETSDISASTTASPMEGREGSHDNQPEVIVRTKTSNADMSSKTPNPLITVEIDVRENSQPTKDIVIESETLSTESQEIKLQSQISVEKIKDEIQAMRAQTESRVVELETNSESMKCVKPFEASTEKLKVRQISAEEIFESTAFKEVGKIEGEKIDEFPEPSKAEVSKQVEVASLKVSEVPEPEAKKNRVMSEFAETEKSFFEQFLQPQSVTIPLDWSVLLSGPVSPPKSPEMLSPPPFSISISKSIPPPRSSSPTRPVAGLDHLNQLLKIMDKMSSLRVQNSQLRKKCTYLEETKSLLRVQNEMLQFREHCRTRSKSSRSAPQKVMQYLSTPSSKTRDRCPSDSSDTTTTSDQPKQERGPEKHTAAKLHHRSQSMGSIDLADIELGDTTDQPIRHKPAEKEVREHRPQGRSVRLESKKSRKFLKWQSRMKKVFSPNKAVESSSHKGHDTCSINAEQLVRVNSKNPNQQKPPGLIHMKSLDASMIPVAPDIDLDTRGLFNEDKSASRSVQNLAELLNPPVLKTSKSEPSPDRSTIDSETGKGSLHESDKVHGDDGRLTSSDSEGVPKVFPKDGQSKAASEEEEDVWVKRVDHSESLPSVVASNSDLAHTSGHVHKDRGDNKEKNANDDGHSEVVRVLSGSNHIEVPKGASGNTEHVPSTPSDATNNHHHEKPAADDVKGGNVHEQTVADSKERGSGSEGETITKDPNKDSIQRPPSQDLRKQNSVPSFESQEPASPTLKSSCSAGSLTSQEIATLLSGKPDPKPAEPRQAISDHEGDDKAKLDVIKKLIRRKSSPTLCVHGPNVETLPHPRIGRSASFRVKKTTDHGPDGCPPSLTPSQISKSTPGSPNDGSMSPTNQEDQCRSHPGVSTLGRRGRSAWGRVKDIIHTRKDSLKRGSRRSRRTLSSDGHIMADLEAELSSDPGPLSHDWESKEGDRTDGEAPGPAASLASGEHSPKVKRKSTTSDAGSPSGRRKASVKPVDMKALMGSVSDEFNKKMQEWEEKKKRGLVKSNSFTFEEPPVQDKGGLSKDFIKKMEEWTKMKGIHNAATYHQRGSIKEEQLAPPNSNSTQDVSSPLHGIQEWQKTLSSTLSKTVQEITGRRSREGGSPVHDRKVSPDARSRKEERSKSRDRERDRSRQKYEREMQKIERKELKIEKEKQKLEKLKLKLDASYESSSSSDQGVSHEFMKKLQEWETIKGGIGIKLEAAQDAMPTENLPTRSKSHKMLRESSPGLQRDRVCSDSSLMAIQLSPPAQSSSSPTPTSPESPLAGDGPTHSQTEPSLAHQYGQKVMDESLHNDLTLTLEDFFSLEDSNKQLIYEVQQKDEDIMLLQEELRQLTERMNALNKDYSEDVSLYRQELWATSRIGRYTIESDLMTVTLKDLQQKFQQLQEYGERLASEKQQMEVKNIQEARKRMEAENKLLEEIEKLQLTLDKKTLRGGKEVFEQLYQFVIKVQGQLNDLKIGVLERNRILEEMERHLLVQEVTNKLMEAELEQRDTQLQFFRVARKNGTIRRWNTFAGRDLVTRQNGSTQLRRAYYPMVHTSHKDIHRMVRSLSYSNLNSLDLHLEWLEGLKKDVQDKEAIEVASHAVQVGPDKPDSVTTLVQTVMTLCQCPYVPQARYLTEDGETISASEAGETVFASETRSVQTEEVVDNVCIEAAVQVSEPEVSRCEVEIQTEQEEISRSVATEETPDTKREEPTTAEDTGSYSMDNSITVEEHSFTFTAPVPVQEEATFTAPATEPCTENTFTLSATGQTADETDSSSANPVSQIVVSAPEENTEVEFTFSFNLDEDKKVDNNTEESHVDSVAHITVPDGSCVQSEGSEETSEISFSAVIDNDRSEEDKEKDDDKTSIGYRVPFSEYIRRRRSSETPSEPFDISLPPHPPHSPIIRSKYPRRQRTDFRLHQMYIDSRTWKATPPRRTNRYRRPNSEKPYHCRSVTPASDDDGLPQSPVRGRTSSDSSMLKQKMFGAPMKGSSGSETTVRHVNALGNSPSGSNNPLVLDPFSRDMWFRKSPSPNLRKPLVSPVRRLKTAAELLQDSENKRRPRSLSHDCIVRNGSSVTVSSSSSDKENDKQEKTEVISPDTEQVIQEECMEHMEQPLSESTPPVTAPATGTKFEATVETNSNTNNSEPGTAVVSKSKTPSPPPVPPHKTQPPSKESEQSKANSKPPLKDRTNESKVKKMKAMLTGGAPPQESVRPKQKVSRTDGARPKDMKEKDRPKPGTVARQAELFQAKAKSDAGSLTASQTCKTKAVTVTVTPKAKGGQSDSGITPLDEESSSRTRESPAKTETTTPAAAPVDEPSIKKGQNSPSQISRDGKSHKLFGKKSSGAQSPKVSRGSPKKMGRKGSTSSQKGAISALCASAMTIDVEDNPPGGEPCTSQTTSGGARARDESVERKKKSKFLDGNWLPKTKKFFKASKC